MPMVSQNYVDYYNNTTFLVLRFRYTRYTCSDPHYIDNHNFSLGYSYSFHFNQVFNKIISFLIFAYFA